MTFFMNFLSLITVLSSAILFTSTPTYGFRMNTVSLLAKQIAAQTCPTSSPPAPTSTYLTSPVGIKQVTSFSNVFIRGGQLMHFCSNQAGGVQCNVNQGQSTERFDIVIVSQDGTGNLLARSGPNGQKYCWVNSNQVLTCDSDTVQNVFQFTFGVDNSFYMRSTSTGKICSDELQQVTCNRDNAINWEYFKVLQDSDFTTYSNVNIKGYNSGQYCSSQEQYRCNVSPAQSSELFDITMDPDGYGTLRAKGGPTSGSYCSSQSITAGDLFSSSPINLNPTMSPFNLNPTLVKFGMTCNSPTPIIAFRFTFKFDKSFTMRAINTQKYCQDAGSSVHCNSMSVSIHEVFRMYSTS